MVLSRLRWWFLKASRVESAPRACGRNGVPQCDGGGKEAVVCGPHFRNGAPEVSGWVWWLRGVGVGVGGVGWGDKCRMERRHPRPPMVLYLTGALVTVRRVVSVSTLATGAETPAFGIVVLQDAVCPRLCTVSRESVRGGGG